MDFVISTIQKTRFFMKKLTHFQNFTKNRQILVEKY
ncbi:MAG: hypothetical protein RL757_1086 [Bacteroidota bacterium]|jgi:hypothetical protein